MQAIDKDRDEYLYRQVFDLVSRNIESGALRPGDRLPSLRQMSRQAGVSIPTVRQAYVELERQRRIESRPQSGFYVRAAREMRLVRPSPPFSPVQKPVPVRRRSLLDRVNDGLLSPGLVPLGVANPCMARSAAKGLHRAMKRVMARAEERSLMYAPTCGEPALKRQIAFRYLDTLGISVDPQDVCITSGAQEALSIALQAVAGRGDVIAVESPTYHGLLDLIESLGMLAIEVETCPEEGVTLSALEKTLQAHPVRACIFSTTLNNPLGVSMPEQDRRRLAALIDRHDVVLIEDDVYGELRFDGVRPRPAASFIQSGRVMTCGSFSKTAAPGYRIGWLLAGRYRDEVRRLKRALSCSSGLLQQLTLADFLASGDYDRHLKSLRPVLKRNAERMSACVARYFPAETRTSSPVGGSVLWLELPGAIDSVALFDEALAEGISIAPGPVFSPCDRYQSFIRLSFGHTWRADTETALGWLGRRARTLAA
ncbi:MAG: PLP-dependent aminotransferase family protein [Gammaproteobacteria bacterium]|nr:PLP-dependent aminotransferase family protein [Gammaproteobacteria bacterium]